MCLEGTDTSDGMQTLTYLYNAFAESHVINYSVLSTLVPSSGPSTLLSTITARIMPTGTVGLGSESLDAWLTKAVNQG